MKKSAANWTRFGSFSTVCHWNPLAAQFVLVTSRNHKVLLILALFLLNLPAVRAELSPQQCRQDLEDARQKALHHLSRIEFHYREMRWYYAKYWEIVYSPLWDAVIASAEPYSTDRAAEGKMLAERYRHEAEVALATAEESRKYLNKHRRQMKKRFESFIPICESDGYQKCIGIRAHQVGLKLDELERGLKSETAKMDKFSEHIQKTLDDTPSMHDEFDDRYSEDLLNWHVGSDTGFMAMVRKIRELLEVSWPEKECCALCDIKAAGLKQDPVLKAVRLDPQGTQGADGRVVNNAGILEAFEELESGKPRESAPAAVDPILEQIRADFLSQSGGVDGRIVNNASLIPAFKKMEEEEKRKADDQAKS